MGGSEARISKPLAQNISNWGWFEWKYTQDICSQFDFVYFLYHFNYQKGDGFAYVGGHNE